MWGQNRPAQPVTRPRAEERRHQQTAYSIRQHLICVRTTLQRSLACYWRSKLPLPPFFFLVCFRRWSADEARILRVSVNSFLDHLSLVLEAMEMFGPPVSQWSQTDVSGLIRFLHPLHPVLGLHSGVTSARKVVTVTNGSCVDKHVNGTNRQAVKL